MVNYLLIFVQSCVHRGWFMIWRNETYSMEAFDD